MARPSDFSREIADTICERLIEGESLRSICRDDEMPSASTVCRWLSNDEAFQEQYAHARELQADTLFDEIVDIADGRKALLEGNDPDVQRDRLSVDARKWMAGKLRPKKYGEKVLNEHSGPDGKPIQTAVVVEFVKSSAGTAT